MGFRLGLWSLSIAFVLLETGESTTTSPCGGTLSSSITIQSVQSPNYPTISTVNQTCVWTINSLNTSNTVLLTLDDIKIREGNGCPVDSLKVYDGSEATGQLMATWCGQMAGDFVQSTGPNVTVVYTVTSNSGRGFKVDYHSIHYISPQCTVDLDAKDSYSFQTSMRYPYSYQHNMSCYYTVVTTHGQAKVEFLNVDLPPEVNGTCTSDHVTVYDGYGFDNIELKSINTRRSRTCGTDLPVYIASGTDLLLVFNTAASGNYTGFRFRYIQGNFSSQYIPPCGGDLTATDTVQTFTSPNYPNGYPRSVLCTWTIRSENNTQNVRVTGRNLNLTDGISTDAGCRLSSDKLNIYDRSVSTTNIMTTVCGVQARLVQQTFSNTMTLVFTTRFASTAQGFSLNYIQTTDNPPCNYTYKAPQLYPSTIASAGYPRQYRTNTKCTWIIEKTSGSTVGVEFLNASISTNCSADHVSVYDGDSDTNPLIGRFCGTETPTFRSRGKNLFLVFITGPTVQGHGLKFNYMTSERSVCPFIGLQAAKDVKYLTSTNYPYMYSRNVNCTYHINCLIDHTIAVDVVMSDIEKSQDCKNDWVAVYDGFSNEDPLLGKWCGNQTGTYRSTGPYIYIVLHSNDNAVTGRGFKLKYNMVEKPAAPGPNIGVIVGGVMGGIAGLALLAALAFVVVYKRDSSQGYKSPL